MIEETYNDAINHYRLVDGECPYCKAHLVYRNDSMILTSNPPQHQYHCKRCGHVWSAHNDKEAVEPIKDKEDSPMHSFEPSLNSECISEETTAGKSFSYSIGDVPGDSFKYWGQQGWVCPKCGRVNAPHVNTCPCSEPHNTYVTTGTNTPPHWELMPKTITSDGVDTDRTRQEFTM